MARIRLNRFAGLPITRTYPGVEGGLGPEHRLAWSRRHGCDPPPRSPSRGMDPTTMSSGIQHRTPAQLSPEGQAASAWFRQLARALKVSRLYKSDNPVVKQAQEAVTIALQNLL